MPLVRMLLSESFEGLVRESSVANPLATVALDARQFIAHALTCEDGVLDPHEDIEIVVNTADHKAGDHTPCDISLAIEAVNYPDRVANQDERAQEILDGMKRYYPALKIGVWLDLKPATWVSG